MSYYATLQGCRNTISANVTADDQDLADLIPRASRWIEDYCRQNFDERILTRYFSAQVAQYDLHFRGVPIIDVTALTNGDGTTINTASITLYPRNRYPKTRLELDTTQYFWVASRTLPVYDDPDGLHKWEYSERAWMVDQIAATCKVGFHQDYASAWLDSGNTVKTGGITDVATTLNLTSAAGTAIDVGNILKVESEYMLVTGPVASTSAATAITVRRGYNGSTAAAHLAGVAIYVWQTEPVIQEATERLVAAMYKSRDNATGDRMVVEGLGAISIPSGVPSKVRDLLVPPYYNVIGGSVL